MKNYKQTASDVLRLVGGEKNVVQVEHCSTRLRFTLADTSKVDAAALKKTAGVMGVISSGPQCQVVIGNDVIEVYDELLKLGTFNAGQAAAPAAPKGKKEIGGIILDYMVGIFQPLVPAIAGAGVLKALMVLLSTLGLMSSGDIAYKVFVGVADAALYYLPVMVAFTTATKFNCNKLVSVALAAAMIHPSVSALLATEGGAYFLGIKLQNIAYGGQVFPAILTVIFMSFIEKWANKWCPKAIRVFFVPMLCFGIGFPVALVVLGPLGYNIGALLTTVILALYNTLGWLAVALLAAVLPFMISMGMHKALVPYAVASISDPGFEMLYMAIAEKPLREVFCTRRNYLPTVLRLVVCPLVVLVLLWVCHASSWVADGKNILMTVYLAAITPACATVTSMAQLYDRDAAHSSALYVLTTLLSIVSMPVMIGLFDLLL